MEKLKMTVRWTLVMSVLGFFTIQSLSVIGVVSPDKALASDIKRESEFNDNDKDTFFVDDDDENRGLERRKVVCSLNQMQLDALREQFIVTTKTIQTRGGDVSLAVVRGGKKTNKKDIYNAIGVDKKDCKIIKKHKLFTLFLLPGVS